MFLAFPMKPKRYVGIGINTKTCTFVFSFSGFLLIWYLNNSPKCIMGFVIFIFFSTAEVGFVALLSAPLFPACFLAEATGETEKKI